MACRMEPEGVDRTPSSASSAKDAIEDPTGHWCRFFPPRRGGCISSGSRPSSLLLSVLSSSSSLSSSSTLAGEKMDECRVRKREEHVGEEAIDTKGSPVRAEDGMRE